MPNKVDIAAPGKLFALSLIIVGCFTYIIVGAVSEARIDAVPAWATVTLVTGYLVGNGVGAMRGIPQVPTFRTHVKEKLDGESDK